MNNNICILKLSHDEARKFFLQHQSYCNIDLPKYFSFTELLEKLSHELSTHTLQSISISKSEMAKSENVNYLMYANKDGKLSWRPLQIIHPVVYVDLVHHLTTKENWLKLQTRFNKFQDNPKIQCLSIPVQSGDKKSNKAHQISNWWELVEQQSIFLSLKYKYLFDTDIADCYGSIYTHSIAWAIEGKTIAKSNHNTALLGNFIDKSIQNAQFQQTNGIPQGSVLMDFVAEMVLGYIDRLLSFHLKKQKIENYQILRYRDDYRIFVNNSSDGEMILKILSEIMMPFGLKLNASKTRGSQDVITQSIKKDKLAWIKLPKNNKTLQKNNKTLQKRILLIRQHGIEYSNSGSLLIALNKYDKKIEKYSKIIHDIPQLVAIVGDIAYNNPKSIPICCSIISKLLNKSDNSTELSNLIYQKLNSMSHSGFAQVWLQRMLKSNLQNFQFTEKMCLFYQDKQTKLWNSDWIQSKKILRILEQTSIFLENEFNELDTIIHNEEIDIFHY